MKTNLKPWRADAKSPQISNHWKNRSRKFPIIGSFRFIAASLLLSASAAIAAEFPSAWKNVQPVTVDKTGLVRLSVPLETLDAARPGLEDLRLYDSSGREVPFIIERPLLAPNAVMPAKNFRVALVGNSTVATMENEIAEPIDSIVLENPAKDFLKGVTLEASNDGQTWQLLVRNEPVFRQPDGANKVALSFPAGTWKQLRITLDDRRAAPIPLTGARTYAAGPAAAPAEPFDLKIADRDELPGQTRFTLQTAGARIVLAGLEIETPEKLFTRRVALANRSFIDNEIRENEIARGQIYRIALEDQPVSENLSFAADTSLPNRELILTIYNGDSPPLPITAIRAKRRPVLISWMVSQPGTFHLLSGNRTCPPPQYDLNQLPKNVTGTLVQLLERPALGTNPSWQPPEPVPDVAETGIAIDLANWRFRKPIAFDHPGVQQVELDLETLSHANQSFSDLRVVRGGMQRAYLIERTGFSRSFAPDVEKLADPKRPTVSRWQFRLPNSGLPLVELECEADAPFFRRDVTVTEEVPDERGDLNPVHRGSASWLRASGDKTSTLRILLSGPITTDRLVLEFDNGDNPPVELKNFRLTYRATRILFKATPGTDLFLYYGNREANSPRYDLELVAPQMLAAEKSKARLGPAEQLKKAPWTEREHFQGLGSWIFWAALAGVVVVLFIVITRLLPKSNG